MESLEQLPVTGWYPGHMLKAGRQMQERLKLVDLVVELLDARIPATSRNPAFERLFGNKPRCLVFTKADAADPVANRAWQDWFDGREQEVIFVDALSGAGLSQLVPTWCRMVRDARRRGGATNPMRRHLRVMIAGIPNVGKSTLVNRLSASRRAAVGPTPGVTRGQQWIPLEGGVELLDTPGVLWPRIRNKRMELKLGLAGTIKDDVVGVELLAEFIWLWARENPGKLDFSMYDVTVLPETPEELLVAVGQRRGLRLPGGAIDMTRGAVALVKDFRDVRLGRVTLDNPGGATAASDNHETHETHEKKRVLGE